MVTTMDDSACEITGMKLSTVVPASITASGSGTIHELSNTDLAFKLHYVTTVHFFTGDKVGELTLANLKDPMFRWLQVYNVICGRVRRHDGGRPFVKCNDSGVRIVEASCGRTMTEWLATVNCGDHHRLLVYNHPILADNFEFTPLVFLQLTRFKCGGLCVGMSWAHFLGDGYSAADCINMWGKMMSAADGAIAPKPLTTSVTWPATPWPWPCRSLKQLKPVEDNWLTPTNVEMLTHSYHFSEKQLAHKYVNDGVSPFDLITAVIWKALAGAGRAENEIITVVKKRKQSHGAAGLGNDGVEVGIVEAEGMREIADADPVEIARMIAKKFSNERGGIEENTSGADFLVYGANLTFVDWLDVNLDGLQIKGHAPVFASISVNGVGDEGAVVVAPAPGKGATVNVILPKHQLQHLKMVLRSDFSIS